jgi:hypothetical protein
MAYPEKQSLVGQPAAHHRGPEISDRSLRRNETEPCQDKPATETASTGAVRETLYHKGRRGFPVRPDLVMRNDVGFERLAETYGEGFLKYGADNWMKGFPESVLVAHALNHIQKHLAGDKCEDHIAHAIWNLYTLAWVQEKRHDLMDVTGGPLPTDPRKDGGPANG